jgi:hypothetical protein
MPGPGRQQQHPWLARILYDVVNGLAEKLRARELPVAARAIGAQRKQTLTRSDPQRASHDEEDPRRDAALSTAPQGTGSPGAVAQRMLRRLLTRPACGEAKE